MNNKNFEHLYFMQKCPLFGIFQVHTTNPTAMVVSMRTWHCFLGATAPGHSQDPPEEVDAELQLMAELEENKWPNDGEVKILIPSEEEFVG